MADTERGTNKDEVVLEHREAESVQHHPHTPAVEVALHHDRVAPEAIGGLYEEMPKGYYWSKDFLGTLIVSNSGNSSSNHFRDVLTSSGDMPCPNQRILGLGLAGQHTFPN
jgi:hypothetical protein